MEGHDALRAEAERLKREGALGRSEPLLRLFDYLVERSGAERAPKEVEVAMDVFHREPGFEPARDAVVRVYAHKLRQRLAEIYARAPEPGGLQLTLPRGEYRLAAAPAPPTDEDAPPPRSAGPPGLSPRAWAVFAGAVVGAMILASAATWWIGRAAVPPAARELARVADGPVWGPLLRDKRPVVIALGDYYIFGESPDGMEVARLVREYAINSRQDLAEYLMSHPDKAGRYVDLDLRYLPIGVGAALRRIAPVIAQRKAAADMRVVMMSDLTPEMLKANNVVYIGYLSGMDWLRGVVLAGSRFSIGETFDDVIDRRTNRRYASQGGPSDVGAGVYRDYGYVATLSGPEATRIVVVAGTRDAALMQTAEELTRPASLAQAAARGGDPLRFEALYEVDGMDRFNVDGRLLVSSALASAPPEPAQPRRPVPAG